MILIFHQNHSAFLRWLPLKNFKVLLYLFFFFFAPWYVFFLCSLPNWDALLVTKLYCYSKVTRSKLDSSHVQFVDDHAIRHYTRSILCSSQLPWKSIIFLPLTIPAHAVSCYEPESRQHWILLVKIDKHMVLPQRCNSVYGSDLLPPYYTQLYNTIQQIIYVASKLPMCTTCTVRINTINKAVY